MNQTKKVPSHISMKQAYLFVKKKLLTIKNVYLVDMEKKHRNRQEDFEKNGYKSENYENSGNIRNVQLLAIHCIDHTKFPHSNTKKKPNAILSIQLCKSSLSTPSKQAARVRLRYN